MYNAPHIPHADILGVAADNTVTRVVKAGDTHVVSLKGLLGSTATNVPHLMKEQI